MLPFSCQASVLSCPLTWYISLCPLQAISDANVVLDIREREFEAAVFFDNWVYELGLSKQAEREKEEKNTREFW